MSHKTNLLAARRKWQMHQLKDDFKAIKSELWILNNFQQHGDTIRDLMSPVFAVFQHLIIQEIDEPVTIWMA